jgi:hypothetical protein
MPQTNTEVSAFGRSYNSFSGVDIKAVFGRVTIGELQAISYSITREKAPIYTMGSADPRAFSRGKRGIAGTLIFAVFDRHALLTELDDLYFQADRDDVRPEYVGGKTGTLDFSLSSLGGTPVGAPIGGGIAPTPAYDGGVQQETAINNQVWEDQIQARPWYVDQIPGFDITLTAANEYGALAVMKIFGVELLNEGYGISVDDVMSEQQYTYIARSVVPWQWVRPRDAFANRYTGG